MFYIGAANGRSIRVESQSDDSTSIASTERDEGRETVTEATRKPSGRTRPVTARWQVGRLVRVSLEAACGFIRSASGELIYFAMDDVVSASGELRAGSRVRFQPVGAGVPRALRVQRV